MDKLSEEFSRLEKCLPEKLRKNSEFLDSLKHSIFVSINGFLTEKYGKTYHTIDIIKFHTNIYSVINMVIYSNELGLTINFKYYIESKILCFVDIYLDNVIHRLPFNSLILVEPIDIDKFDKKYNLLKIIAVIKTYRDRHKYLTKRICREIRYLPPKSNFLGGIKLLTIIDLLCCDQKN